MFFDRPARATLPIISKCSSPRAVNAARRCYASKAYSTPGPADSTAGEVAGARAYCSNLLRHFDGPSFTLQTFIPSAARDAYLAIRAFNIEVARVADATSNPTVGAMRMQFWRDAINKAFAGAPPKEPVTVLLSYVLDDLSKRTEGRSRLSKGWFLRIINTREQYLNNAPFPTMPDLETYAENTYSTLLYLTLSALPLTSVTADHLASHIGKATGISAVLRGLPLIAFPSSSKTHNNPTALGGIASGGRQGAVILPLDVMADAGVREEEIFRSGSEAKGLRDAVFTVATRANDHLITAREMLKNIRAGKDVGHEFEHQYEEEHENRSRQPTASQSQNEDVDRAFGVLMPAIATELWLEKLQKSDFDVFAPKLRSRDWRLPWRAYWAYSRRQI